MIAYSSVYGNTKKAVEVLAQKLEEKGCPKSLYLTLQEMIWLKQLKTLSVMASWFLQPLHTMQIFSRS